MFLPFQFLPLSFYTPLSVSLCCLQKLVLASAGFLYPARSLRRQYDIRTLSLPARVQSLFPSVDALVIVFGMYFLSESRSAFLEVGACNCSEELSMRKV